MTHPDLVVTEATPAEIRERVARVRAELRSESPVWNQYSFHEANSFGQDLLDELDAKGL